jgi:hypothetical protein
MSYSPPASDDVDFELEPSPSTPPDDVDFTLSPAIQAVARSSSTATATTTAEGQLVTTAAIARSTAVETKSRLFKFATTQATTSTQIDISTQTTTDTRVNVSVSTSTTLSLRELTPQRRSLNALDNTDPTFERTADLVEYDITTDPGPEYEPGRDEAEYDERPEDVEFDS